MKINLTVRINETIMQPAVKTILRGSAPSAPFPEDREVITTGKWKLPKDFLLHPQYFNTVPPVPAGPFFKDVGLTHDFEDFAAYHVSSLEKNYLWKPHHVNITRSLDVVDQETLLQVDKGNGTKLGAAELGIKIARENVSTDDILWLKKTTYLTNHLFQSVNKFSGHGDALVKEQVKQKAKENNPKGDSKHDCFHRASIESSFRKVALKTKARLEADQRNSRTIEWECPVLPDEARWESEMCLLAFDEDPSAGASVGDGRSGLNILSSVVTNIRTVPNRSGEVSTSAKYAVSLVAPSASIAEVSAQKEFSWVNDFRMDIKAVNVEDLFVFAIERPSDDTPPSCVAFAPLSSKVELKRLARDECSEHIALIKQRPLSAEEEKESAERISKRLRSK